MMRVAEVLNMVNARIKRAEKIATGSPDMPASMVKTKLKQIVK